MADTYIESKIYMCLGQSWDIICLSFYHLYRTSYDNIQEKIFWGYWLVYMVVSAIFLSYIQLSADHIAKSTEWLMNKTSGSAHINGFLSILEHVFVPFFVAYIAYQIYCKLSFFDKKNSAKLNKRDIFIAFRYPHNYVGLFLALFTPIKANTVCLYADGFFYKYDKRYGHIRAILEDNIEKDKYFFVNTGIRKTDKDLNKIVGDKWSIGNNCLTVFQTITGPLKNYIG